MNTKTKYSGRKLKIGYTLGDLAGIGPEIFDKFQKNFLNSKYSKEIELVLIDDLTEIKRLSRELTIGKASAQSGEHCFRTLKKATAMAMNSEIDFLVTGPVAKESLWLAGYEFSGQTELLAHLSGLSKDEIEMFFILDNLRIVLATRHIALKDVSKDLEKRLSTVIKNSIKGMEKVFQIEKPKIAVAGLNPHSGENGIIGSEELDFINPIIDLYKSSGYDISGPIPADYLFAQAAQAHLHWETQKFDLHVAAYHDQALPMIKGIGGFRAINLTVGLPFIRMSVDHGTGFDIAGKNLAKSDGLQACTEFCLKLAKSSVLV